MPAQPLRAARKQQIADVLTGLAAGMPAWAPLLSLPVRYARLYPDGSLRPHTHSDPRAGSAMTAMPGLPFGRQFIVRPVPGACAVVPGWLTSSVIPLEPRQRITIAIATGR